MTTVPHGNIPAALTSFVGRRKELAEVKKRLASARLLTLTGMGGVGKTRLAVQTAVESQRGYRDGTWLVDLASVQDPGLLWHTVASALGLTLQSTRTAEAQLLDHLQTQNCLLVLDNCEHLLEAAGRMVDRILGTASEVRVLATS